jgi:hypothetical protein
MRHLLDDKRPLAEFLDEHCRMGLGQSSRGKGRHRRRMVSYHHQARALADRKRNVGPSWIVSAQSLRKHRSSKSTGTARGSGTSRFLIPDFLTGTRSGCIAANTEVSSRKPARHSCEVSWRSFLSRRDRSRRPQSSFKSQQAHKPRLP